MIRDRSRIRRSTVSQLTSGKIAAADARYEERMEAVYILRGNSMTVPEVAATLRISERTVQRLSAERERLGWMNWA